MRFKYAENNHPGKTFISVRNYRIKISFLSLLLAFFTAAAAQITKDPDVDSICSGTSITLTYDGPGSFLFWITTGGSPSSSASSPFTVTYNNPGDFTIDVYALLWIIPIHYSSNITVVPQPTGPTLNTQIPSGSPCEGEPVSATFHAGSGGVSCSDEFRYSTRTGTTWYGPYAYTEGQLLSSGGIDEIIIEGRRANCDETVGCTETSWVTLAQWSITPDVTSPVISTCATDKFYNAGPSCQVTVPDLTSEVLATDNCDPDPEITQSPLAGSTIGEGVTTVTITVTDAGGNTASCTADITVTDITDPVITGCPSNINTAADTSYCGTYVTWTEPTATDNCPGVVLSSTYSPGDFFPVGTTTVTCTATDGTGNTDLCTFDIDVQSAADPVITGPATVCTPVQETYSVMDPGSHTFQWVITNGTIVGSDTDPSVTVEWTGTVQGNVSVTITSGSGCTSSGSITVDQFATPETGNINSSNSLTRR